MVEEPRRPGRPRKEQPEVAQNQTTERTEDKVTNIRPKRTPMSGPRNIMTVEGLPEGFEYRWINDQDNRIQRAIAGGWDHVINTDGRYKIGDRQADPQHQIGAVVSKLVGTDKFGKPLTAYFMAIREDWYLEDQLAKQREIEKNMKALDTEARNAGLVERGTHSL